MSVPHFRDPAHSMSLSQSPSISWQSLPFVLQKLPESTGVDSFRQVFRLPSHSRLTSQSSFVSHCSPSAAAPVINRTLRTGYILYVLDTVIDCHDSIKHFYLWLSSHRSGWQFNWLKFSLEKPLGFWLEFWLEFPLDSTEEKKPF